MTLPAVRNQLGPLITTGVVTTCATPDAEALYGARSPTEYDRSAPTGEPHTNTEDPNWQQAFDVQRALAATGRHRAVGVADLRTAVLAAHHGATLIHYDSDFDIAAESRLSLNAGSRPRVPLKARHLMAPKWRV